MSSRLLPAASTPNKKKATARALVSIGKISLTVR